MKKIKLLLAAATLLLGGSAFAQTDAEYADANAAIEANGVYKIYTLSDGTTTGSTKYYLKTDGYLTDDAAAAGQFTFDFQRIFGGFKMGGYRINRFTNGGAQNNTFSGDALKRIAVSSNQNRTDWEAQVFFKNEDGYAVRSTNSKSSNWGASAYWTVVADNDDDGLPNATYTTKSVPYVWQLEKVTAGDWSDVTAKYITNYNPTTNSNGWDIEMGTNLGQWAGNNYNKDNNVAEFYRRGGATFKQTLNSLPSGYYTLTALAFTRTDYTATLSAGDDFSMSIATVGSGSVNNVTQAKDWLNNGNGVNELPFAVDATSNVTIGLTTSSDGDAWTIYRAFYLTYNSEPVALRKALAQAKETANTALGNASFDAVTGFERTQLNASVAKTVDETQAASAVVTAYNNLIEEIATNLAAFTAAPTYYSQLPAANAKAAEFGLAAQTTESQSAQSALDVQSKAIYNKVVTEYNTIIDLGEWQTTGEVGTMTSQHWDGTSTSSYNEQSGAAYSATSWTLKYYQTINLPAGDYVFKVAGRHSASASLELNVKKGETVLGTVNDFPAGDRGYGINKAGVPSFFGDDPAGFARDGGTGGGWQWRYVPFTITEENADITISIDGSSDAQYQWLGFCNYTVQSAPSVAASRVAYNQAKSTAIEALENGTYSNVQGTDRSNLETAVDATPTESMEWYDAQTILVQNLTNTFTSGVASWNSYVTNYPIEKAKADAISSTIAAGLAAPTTAAEAAVAVNNLMVAEYNYVTTTYQYAVNLGDWNASDNAGEMTGQHWDGTGSSKYLEQGGGDKAYNQPSWTVTYDQNIQLPAGNYVFKVAGRTASDHVTINLNVTDVTDSENPELLGTVNDFPKGDVGLGINKEGATSFDSSDPAGFANNNKGRGWQWRYVKFTLTEAATVKVAVVATADAQHRWMGFCNATVQTDNEANTSLITYNIALASAIAARDNQTYKYVGGTDRSNLTDAIAADESLNKSDKDAIDAATATLNATREAFIGGVSSWNAYVTAKNSTYEKDQPYASDAKYDAITTAKNASAPVVASEAATKAAAIISAYRQYIESNALAEGVDGAVNKTNLIVDPNFAGVSISGTKAGGWTFDQTGGSVGILSSEPFTDGSGNSSYSYFDYYNNGSNNQNVHQVISDLAPGRYLLTATARAHANFSDNLRLYVVGKGDTKVSCVGSTGGVFDRGWNDVSLVFDQLDKGDVTIGMKTDANKNQWWGVTRFRLVKISDVATMAISSEAEYATFIAPFDVTIPDDVEASTIAVDAIGEDDILTLTPVETTIPANTPVVLFKEGGLDATTFYGKDNSDQDEYTVGLLTGVYTTKVAPDGSYILQKHDGEDAGFYKVNYESLEAQSLDKPKVPANRAYLKTPAQVQVKAFFFGGDADGIKNVLDSIAAGKIYDLSGRKVAKMQKGNTYIVNGKKVNVK